MTAVPAPASVDMIRKLVGFDTTSRNSNLDLIAFVEAYLHGHGVATRRVSNEDGTKANLYATVGPTDRPGIMLSGHTDVVPVDGQDWTADPFTAVARDGRLYGRGTADMKSFIAVVLAHVPEMVARNLRIPLNFAFSYDEEIGCIGVRRLIEAINQMPVRPAMCIIGEPTDMKVVIAHKGKANVRVRVRGLEAHSSLAPRAVNAIAYAAELIVYLNRMAARIAENGPFDHDYDIAHTTVHTGVISGGTQINIVPKDCTFEFEFRYLPQDDPQRLLGEIKEFARTQLEPRMHAIDPHTGFTFEERTSIPGLDVRDNEDVVRLAKALTGQNDHTKVAFGTEAGLFHLHAGIPTVICGPGSIEQAHKPDEWIGLEQVARCDDFIRRLLDHVCARS